MAVNVGAPPRGSTAAAASLRRIRAGTGGAATGGVNTMLQFYTDTTTGWKLTPFSVLMMSTGFIAFVAVLHGFGKFLRA